MKKLCLLLPLLLLLTACATAQAQSAESAANAALESYGAANYVRADDDFLTTNFGELPYVKNAVIYLSKNGDGSEFGFFELTDTRHQNELVAAIKAYLASEEQSVRSLAALYPADDLQARLARFERARVGIEGELVYYAVTDTASRKP